MCVYSIGSRFLFADLARWLVSSLVRKFISSIGIACENIQYWCPC